MNRTDEGLHVYWTEGDEPLRRSVPRLRLEEPGRPGSGGLPIDGALSAEPLRTRGHGEEDTPANSPSGILDPMGVALPDPYNRRRMPEEEAQSLTHLLHSLRYAAPEGRPTQQAEEDP